MATESAFRTLIRAVHAEFTTILEAEERAVPKLVFGRVQWDELQGPAPQIHWIKPGWNFRTQPVPVFPVPEGETAPPMLGTLQARCEVRIFHTSEEQLEHTLLSLWRATDRVASDRFGWAEAYAEDKTEEVGPRVNQGTFVAVLRIPAWIPIPKPYDGEVDHVVVTGNEFRAGLENPEGEDLEDVEYDVDRLTTAWPG